MAHRTLIALSLLAVACAPAAGAAAAYDASAWGPGAAGSASARDVYRDNLVGCISRLKTCERSRLSQEDRDYLTYEMRDQRFAPDVVQQVADVRMEIYGKPVPTVQGRATGTRYPAARPDPAPAQGGGVIGLSGGQPASAGLGDALGNLGNLAEMGGQLVKAMATQQR